MEILNNNINKITLFLINFQKDDSKQLMRALSINKNINYQAYAMKLRNTALV